MTSGYRLYASTSGPAASAADTSQYTMGLAFKITSGSHLLYGYYWWVADASQSTGAQEFALWKATAAHTGIFVTGSLVTSGPLSPDWNYVPLATPIALTAGQEYLAVTAVPGTAGKNSYSSTANYFTSGGAGQDGITSGPLLAYSGAGGLSNNEPLNGANMTYDVGGTDPSANYPGSSGTSANYWIDVQIDDPSPGGVNPAWWWDDDRRMRM